ncbi:MAG: RNA polymerase sigma factor [Bacteroidota bacterium]
MTNNKKYRVKSIDQLIAGCQQGESSSQRQLFELFAGQILTVCRRYESQRTGADDILQETFIKAFAKIHQFDPDKGQFKAWLKRIAINTALKSLRSKAVIIPIQDNHLSHSMTVDTSAPPELSEEQILQLIQSLPTGYRTVFNLYTIDGYSHKEIAEKLQISIQTSKSQLSKAKAQLRKKIQTISAQKADNLCQKTHRS